MIRKIGTRVGQFLRGTTALVVVVGLLSALAVTVTVGSLLRDDGENRKVKNNQPTTLR